MKKENQKNRQNDVMFHDTMDMGMGHIETDLIDVNKLDLEGYDLRQRRYEIAKTVIHAQISGPIIPGVDPNPSVADLVKSAVNIADALIAELKKNKEQ